MINVSLPDGSRMEIAAGSSIYEVARAIGPRLAKDSVCAVVDGRLRDMRERLEEDASVRLCTRGSERALEVLRHTTTHIMAQAVKRLFPDVLLGIGPAIEDGFYYDFDTSRPFTTEELSSIEGEMRKIISEGFPIERMEVKREKAREILSERGELLKLELLDDLVEETVTLYRQGEFIDLCRGPHLASTDQVNGDALKLRSVAGAYWRGDEDRPMLQRIYGTVWESQEDLAAYLEKMAQVEARDHRKLIKDLDLVSFHEEAGAGLAYWHPKGGRMRVLIEDYWRELHYAGGYEIVFTPHIGRAQLWETSGHLDFYREGMYAPMDIDGQDYYIKPMNCPFHIMIYKSRTRSYRELPLRWAELGTVYRYERSGTLHGLMRVRGFTQDDAHIFCTPGQVKEEILNVLDFSLNLLRGFGFSEFQVELSVRDPARPEKYAGGGSMWEQAETSLVRAIEARGLSYERREGEAVFYGPKIDVKIKDVLNRTWQLTTIQFDFNLPRRFDMSYIGKDGAEHQPYMIHRALLGSLERFYGILVEHYAGAFPVWLSPVQVMVIPISDRHASYAMKVIDRLKQAGIRAEVDLSSGRMNAKIRNAQLEKVPYMLIVGEREEAAGTVSLRLRTEEDLGGRVVEEFIEMVDEKVRTKQTL